MTTQDKAGLRGKKILHNALLQILLKSEDYVFVKNRELVYLAVSEHVARMAGVAAASAMVGRTDKEIFPQELALKYQRDDRQVLESGQAIIGMVETLPPLHGVPRWTKTWKYPLFDEQQQIVGLYGISRDITREKVLEATAAEAQKYVELIKHIPGGIGILHEEGEKFFLDYANDGWFAAHRISPEQTGAILGADVFPMIYPEDQAAVAKIFAGHGEGKSADTVSYRFVDAAGTVHWIQLHFCKAYVAEGRQYYYATVSNMDEQMSAEEKLQESRDTLREVISNSDIQFFTYFPGQHRGEIYLNSDRLHELPQIWNNFPEDFLQYTRANATDAKAYREMLNQIENGAAAAECKVRLAYKGNWSWEHIRLKALRNPQGKTVKAQGYSVNVTREMEASEQIRKERVRQKTLEGKIFEAFSFNLTKNSEPYFNTTDKSVLDEDLPEELVKRSLRISPALTSTKAETRRILLHAANMIPDQKEQELFIKTCSGAAVRDALSKHGNYKAEIKYRRRRGNLVRWVQTSVEVLKDPESQDYIAFYYTQDINDSVMQERIFRKLIERNYVTLSFYDLQSRTLYVKSTGDARMASYNGVSYEEALEDALKRVVPSTQETARQDYAMDTIKAVLEKQGEYTAYFTNDERVENLPGKPFRKMKSIAFYLDEHRDVIVFVVSDVTGIVEQEREQREKLSDALIAAEQASVAKTEFLSRMSHEIRTPMNAIIGLDAIALQEKSLSTSMVDHLQKIGISARFLLSLINDILDMSRIESGRMLLRQETFNFEELINGINTILYQQCLDNDLEYECVLKSYTEPAYVGDATKLQQILVNILGNAVKFTPRGGKIHFMIEQVEQQKGKAKLRFEISDTGIGIDEDFLPKLFQPFTQEDPGRTTSYGGSGLGLAISKNLVGLMGGDIKVHSIKNVGTDFTVEVHVGLTKETLQHRSERAKLQQPLFTLIVDDDVIVCRHTQIVLREAGLKAEWVDSGAAAVNKVTEQRRLRRDYDLILLDLKMPDMDGVETARALRKIVGPEVTIIIMTAYDWANIEQEAREAGVDMFMKKPVFASAVQEVFTKVLHQKKGVLPTAAQPHTFDFVGKRILLVEDNMINAEIAQSILVMKNCTVETAANGAEAVEAFAAAPLGYFDAILMDVRMPVMDGLEATRAIRAMRKASSKRIPIIAMTANAFEEDVNMSLAAGMNAHLSKPIEPDKLYQVLEDLMSKYKVKV
ncbi:MAG: response regulator [Acidaminococcaceae bacterium]|jgi:two-component system sensor histidine kinase/response regulator|nr:response regulator [Acidaminococcaceae bacterium]